jgi:hypothetical protein
MIYFTSDIDWAHEVVIEDMLNIFNEYNQACTLFATHSSEVIKEAVKIHEVAIHPNFNVLFDNSPSTICAEKIVDDLLEVYPNSIGTRSHSLTSNSKLSFMFHDKGLKYESNIILPYQEVKPYKLWNNFIRIPYNWEDDVHYHYNKHFSDPELSLDFQYCIFDFHPIHVFLNTDTEQRYNAAKKYLDDPKKLIQFRNENSFGVRTLLITLLETCKVNHSKCLKLSDICI